jgi:hypothetical protein
MLHSVILADAGELLKVMGVVAVVGLIGFVSLVGAVFNFLSADKQDKKAGWLFLIVGAICFAPALIMFVLPEIAHLLHLVMDVSISNKVRWNQRRFALAVPLSRLTLGARRCSALRVRQH